MTVTTPFLDQEEPAIPSFGDLLMQAAATPREKAAVWALVEEGEVLAVDAVRRNLVCETAEGIEFTWQHLSWSLYGMGLDESGRAFVDLVLSLAGPHQTSLTRVTELGNRRLGIVLQAMTQLADNDTIAIATRL
jgi:hypothetical protein